MSRIKNFYQWIKFLHEHGGCWSKLSLLSDAWLILLSDVIENKVRKERELEFYQEELSKLQTKMMWLKRDIDVNNIIIDMIKRDDVMDIKHDMEKKMIENE